MPTRSLIILFLILADILLFVPGLRLNSAMWLTLFLPGLGWATFFNTEDTRLGQTVLIFGLSLAITTLTTLTLHFLPGPIQTWHLVLILNMITLLPLLRLPAPQPPDTSIPRHFNTPTLFLILAIAIALRLVSLGYSEFQGDEALAMVLAAEAIEGHEDALFLRGKGPGEILLPLAIWRISGPITELLARTPFAVAGIGSILSIFLLAKHLFTDRVALFCTVFFAASGFMVGFSRIVQYQTIVVYMSILALWSMWQWRQSGLLRWVFISGLFAGVGLLAHYDAILVLPALGWLGWQGRWGAGALESRGVGEQGCWGGWAVGVWAIAFLVSVVPFYVPYLLDPQIAGTSSYLGDRIGPELLKNNLEAFLQFNSFYSSFYYLLVIGLLLICFVAWALQQSSWSRWWGPIGAGGAMLGLAIWPNALGIWTAIPLALLLVAAFTSTGMTLPLRLALIWFAVPFMGYNFAVARPLTHIYTIIPGWTLLAGWMMGQFRLKQPIATGIIIGLTIIFSGYLWSAFVRHDRLFLQNYPESNPNFYWTPYPDPPETGFFGFPHNAGWKSVGSLMADGTLMGDYDSNEEEDITSWYTRHARRACDPGAENIFIATSLVDEVPISTQMLDADYQPIGQTTLPNNNGLTIYNRKPPVFALGDLDEPTLRRQFDRTAYPAEFTRTPHWQIDDGTNFGGQIQLLGYALDTQRAYPGGRILLTLYWQALIDVDQSYKVFVQLDPERKFAQADSFPVCSRYPTDQWRPGQIIADHHALHLSLNTPIDSFPLVVGLYLPDDGRRLDILDVAGNPAGVSLTLTEVEVR